MSLFRAKAWRSHPMFQIKLQHYFIGLPTGLAMFAAVQLGESTGLISYNDPGATTPEKYAFVSKKFPAPAEESHGHGHASDHGSAKH